MKRINLRKFANITLLSSTLTLLSFKFAQAVETKVAVGVCVNGQCNLTYTEYVRQFYIYSIRLGLTLTGVMIMFAGYTYLVSQGDTTKLNKAKEYLTGAIIGFFLLITVWIIVGFLGLDKKIT